MNIRTATMNKHEKQSEYRASDSKADFLYQEIAAKYSDVKPGEHTTGQPAHEIIDRVNEEGPKHGTKLHSEIKNHAAYDGFSDQDYEFHMDRLKNDAEAFDTAFEKSSVPANFGVPTLKPSKETVLIASEATDEVNENDLIEQWRQEVFRQYEYYGDLPEEREIRLRAGPAQWLHDRGYNDLAKKYAKLHRERETNKQNNEAVTTKSNNDRPEVTTSKPEPTETPRKWSAPSGFAEKATEEIKVPTIDDLMPRWDDLDKGNHLSPADYARLVDLNGDVKPENVHAIDNGLYEKWDKEYEQESNEGESLVNELQDVLESTSAPESNNEAANPDKALKDDTPTEIFPVVAERKSWFKRNAAEASAKAESAKKRTLERVKFKQDQIVGRYHDTNNKLANVDLRPSAFFGRIISRFSWLKTKESRKEHRVNKKIAKIAVDQAYDADLAAERINKRNR